MATLSALSLEYLRYPVTATRNGAAINPTSDTVNFALVAHGAAPTGGDWVSGSWETTPAGVYFARVLVGPGGAKTLTAGTYDVWIKITDSPEVPVRVVDVVTIT